jgi:glutamine cyclotransferase
MTFARGQIIFANTWKNTRSRVYRMKPPRMDILATFDMPPEAVHTSGLAFDGENLWAVDYISNRCYKLDLEASFAKGQAQVLGSFATDIGGASACCFLQYEGRKCLAISDFMRTSRTYVIRHEDALRAGRMRGSVIFSYKNEGFSQGLESDGQYLYESENKRGVDLVNRMDVAALARTGSARKATVRQFLAASAGVEDLAWDGEYFYTSDETTFRFYRCRLP